MSANFKFEVSYKRDGAEYHDYITERDLEIAKLNAKEEIMDREDGAEVEIINVEWFDENERKKAILCETNLTEREAETCLKKDTAIIYDGYDEFFQNDEFLEEEFEESGKTPEDFLKKTENVDVAEFEGKTYVIQFVV